MWSYFVLMPLAALGAVLLRRRRVQILPLFAQALIVTLVAAATFGLTRYRAGVEVSIVVLAAVALGWFHSALTGSADPGTVLGPITPPGTAPEPPEGDR
jgi:hypothetical protein